MTSKLNANEQFFRKELFTPAKLFKDLKAVEGNSDAGLDKPQGTLKSIFKHETDSSFCHHNIGESKNLNNFEKESQSLEAGSNHNKHESYLTKSVYVNDEIYEGMCRNEERCGKGKLTLSKHGELIYVVTELFSPAKSSNNSNEIKGKNRANLDQSQGSLKFIAKHERDSSFFHKNLGDRKNLNENKKQSPILKAVSNHDKNESCLTKIEYANGEIYKGMCRNGERCGRGMLWSNDGKLIYFGSWAGDKKNGYGLMIYPNGDKYKGIWKDNKRCGRGSLKKISGEEYANVLWKKDKMAREEGAAVVFPQWPQIQWPLHNP